MRVCGEEETNTIPISDALAKWDEKKIYKTPRGMLEMPRNMTETEKCSALRACLIQVVDFSTQRHLNLIQLEIFELVKQAKSHN